MQEGFLDEMPYDVENVLVEYAMRVPHVPVGFQRSWRQRSAMRSLLQPASASARSR